MQKKLVNFLDDMTDELPEEVAEVLHEKEELGEKK